MNKIKQLITRYQSKKDVSDKLILVSEMMKKLDKLKKELFTKL